MPTAVIMPQLGESVTEGTLIKWYKKKGEKVKKDEILYEVSTDKVDSEIPSPASGKLSEIKVFEGEKVPVKTELAIIEENLIEGEETDQSAGEQEEEPEEKPSLKVAKFVSPTVRKLAKEYNVSIDEVKGTGENSRVTKKDVFMFIENRKKEIKAEEVPSEPPPPGTKPDSGELIEKMTYIRKRIAEHMMEGVRNTAPVTNVIRADMSAISEIRKKNKEEFKKIQGFSLTYLPFVAKATILALKKFPVLNAAIKNNDEVVIRNFVNLGIAVALDEKGLIVPVIKHAEEKSLLGLARSINELATKARSEKLSPDDVQGGTFSITNQGSYGSVFSTPMINYPQVAILSLETVTDDVVAVDGSITIKPMAYMPLTWDHRLIDGAVAGMFLNEVKVLLECWDIENPFD